jgi:hypothetical protein
MPTSKRSSSLADLELALMWGAWVELGVSGWQQTHANWAVDPEPLIIATAALEDADPRLRDEALDWCIHNWRYVSRVRLRNLIREQPESVRESWGPFAATVSKHAGVTWPVATRPFTYKMTGKSLLESMEQPSRAWLRLRGMFGLGARTEILRFFLSGHRRGTAAMIAQRAGYAKRVVADECESLEKAGVLRVHQFTNRYYYALDRADALREFVGDVATVTPDWTALLQVTGSLVELERQAETLPNRSLMVEAHRVSEALSPYLDELDIEDQPRLANRDNYWPALRDFADNYLRAWASGKWTPDEHVTALKPRRVVRRPAGSAL